MPIQAKDRIILALDVATEEEAIQLVSELKDYVGFFKVGLGLLNSVGYHSNIVKKVTQLGGKVFLDTKLLDIPNTVADASRGITRQSVRMFNLHIAGCKEMMIAAVEATKIEADRIGINPPDILGVTVLTSISQIDMNRSLKISGSIEDYVGHLARLGEMAGLNGLIASPREIGIIKKNVSDEMLIITPGIRPLWASTDDQKRITTPSEAITRGATHIVIGRPIIRPPQEIGTPVNAAKRIIEEISTI